MPHAELERLVEIMHRLRAECPWDAEQTHRSLVTYLVEESVELVEAIEAGDDTDLVEELGDLLLQVVFHAEIAAGEGRFDLEDVARGIGDKLVARHPYVFSDAPVPDDLLGSWERRKRAEKNRTSVLDGIPRQLSALTRAAKVIARSELPGADLPLEDSSDDIGRQILALVARAQAQGVDAEQVTRAAVRELESRITAREANAD
ncbi:MazG family protein [Micropruina sonneratiae]|uniref:MazG family protein n=1 Tax=Micropruina sonneratiae TaxID=2986940 RepID=UPI002226298D|nr:MazG family protein [Micropruina sp. KQZ13P-5]MCW3158880.1 MazG family protein [Micropruina sp. KQZ13P-5]